MKKMTLVLLAVCVAIILEVINFTSKRNIDLSCLVLNDNRLMVIRVNPLVKEEDLTELITNHNKATLKKSRKLTTLLKDEDFINYLLENIENLYQFEIVEIANIYDKKLSDKKIVINCDLYDLKYKVIKKNCKLTILNVYTRQSEIYKYIEEYKPQKKSIYKINKNNAKMLKTLYKKNISDFEFWLKIGRAHV